MDHRRWLFPILLGALSACSDFAAADSAATLGSSGDDGGETAAFETTSGGVTVAVTSTSDPQSTAGPTSDTAAEESTDGETSDTTPPERYEPIRYPAGRVHSPVTAYVAEQWRAYAARSVEPFEDVFLKAGASSTVSSNTLHCFGSDDGTELGDHEALSPALAYFRGGDAAGTSPFRRTTLAAATGQSAAWVIEGNPSPLDQEWDALAPRWALVHYGSNDMNLGTTHGSAMIPFHESMMTLVDALLARGTVPVLFGVTRRGDSATADLWVESYNAAIRGIAQSRQIPFVDLHEAIDPLPDHGLSADGVHLNAFADGACRLTQEGLMWGYNMRNLVALQALDRAMEVVVDDAVELDADGPGFVGAGTHEDPLVIDAFPFAHAGDTSRATSQSIDAYPSCDDADESGPEVRYTVQLQQATALRVMVLDAVGVDVDVHIVEAGGDGDTCVARGDRRVEGVLPAGDWDIIVDTWSSGADTFDGEYLLVVLPCQPGDEACAGGL